MILQVPDESFPAPKNDLKKSLLSPVKTVSKLVRRVISPIKLFAANLANQNPEEPATMNMIIEPFFTNKWLPKKGGKKHEGKLRYKSYFFSKN